MDVAVDDADTAVELAASLAATLLAAVELGAVLEAAIELTAELDTATELALELLATSSAGGVPLKPVAFSLVKASTNMPSLITTFSGAKSTRLLSKLQLALPQRALSKLLKSSRQPPSNVLVVVL